MLFLDAYRLIRRTYAAWRQPIPEGLLIRKTGLFSTPIGAALLTGSIAAGINMLPVCCFQWSMYRTPLKVSLVIFVELLILILGPIFVFRMSGMLKRAVRFACLLTLLLVSLPLLAFHLHVISIARHYYDLNVLVKAIGAAWIGSYVARVYGYPAKWKTCAWLSILGNLPTIAYHFWIMLLVKAYPAGDIQISKDVLVFMLMAQLFGTIGVVTIPAVAIESAMKRDPRNQ